MSTTVNVADLVRANNEDFEKALKWNLRRAEWPVFMEPEVIDRTNDVLATIISSISTQLTEHADNGTPEWKRRAKTLLSIIQGRKGEVNRAIKDLNRTEWEEVDEWRKFAAKLASALDAAGARTILTRINVPGDEDTTALEWLTVRRERAAAKAAA